jgi:hypothetical protein
MRVLLATIRNTGTWFVTAPSPVLGLISSRLIQGPEMMQDDAHLTHGTDMWSWYACPKYLYWSRC